jgi:Tfp pilus assembly major pilin PilA
MNERTEQPQPPAIGPPPSIVAIRAIVIIVVITVIGLIAVNVLVPGDNTALTVQIVGIVAPTTAALLSLLSSAKNHESIKETRAAVSHTTAIAHEVAAQASTNTEMLAILTDGINGRLTQLLQKNEAAARLLGREEGGKDARDRHGGR